MYPIMEKERTLLLKRQVEFLCHIMMKDGLENLTITRDIEGKRDKKRQWATYLMILYGWCWVGRRNDKGTNVAMG